jgi:mannose-6-phosphate isomerase-like protein (cupin superfamily)
MDNGAHVLRPSEMQTIDRGTGVRTWLLASREIGSQHITTGITEFQDGTAIALHYHNCEEQVTILEGDAIAEIDGVQYTVSAPDTTFIPSGVPHRFLNRSGKVMKILWIYGSTNVTRTFVETGVTVPHLSAGDRAAAAR